MNPEQLFKVIKRLAGRGLTQTEVDEINAALAGDIIVIGSKGFKTGTKGIDTIHSFESFKANAYKDPGSANGLPITIGWGSTTDENGKPIKLGDVWTRERADARFAQDLVKFEIGVNTLLGGSKTTQNQFDALVSFAYNVGLDIDDDNVAEGLGDSTLLRKHKAGDFIGAGAEFMKWNKNDGKVLAGLTRRRSVERVLYES